MAKERRRVRVDPKTPLLVPIPHLGARRFIPRDRLEAQAFASVRHHATEHPELAAPNILWLAALKALQIVCFSLVTLTRLLY